MQEIVEQELKSCVIRTYIYPHAGRGRSRAKGPHNTHKDTHLYTHTHIHTHTYMQTYAGTSRERAQAGARKAAA
jgi:hypothetical protein